MVQFWQAVRTMYNRDWDGFKLDYNPVSKKHLRDLRKKNGNGKSKKHVPHNGDLEKALDQLPDNWKDYFTVQYMLGARPGFMEGTGCQHIRPSDVDFETCQVTLKHHKGGYTEYTVPFKADGELAQILRRRIDEKPENYPYLFYRVDRSTGKPIPFISGHAVFQLKQACKKAEVEYFHPHALRHRRAMDVYHISEGNVPVVQRYLGHEDLETTYTYLKSLGIDPATEDKLAEVAL